MQTQAASSTALLEPFVRQNTVLLTTLRRDGTPVGTPVHIAVEGDHAYIRTWSTAGKMKRMRNNPLVELAPSTIKGTPTGAAIAARARVLSGQESAHAGHMLGRKYPFLHGFLIPLGHRLTGHVTVHVELRPIES